jgi:catechol 2,3-dioxygenase-like lactoylglutathione lyase family enzyme
MKLEFHHINFVSKDVEKMNNFYKNVLDMDSIPIENFPRTEETTDSGYSGKINFVTEGKIEMHLAERDLNVAFKNKQTINPVDQGHIAFRTDNIKLFLERLKKKVFRFLTMERLLPKNGIKFFSMTQKEM